VFLCVEKVWKKCAIGPFNCQCKNHGLLYEYLTLEVISSQAIPGLFTPGIVTSTRCVNILDANDDDRFDHESCASPEINEASSLRLCSAPFAQRVRPVHSYYCSFQIRHSKNDLMFPVHGQSNRTCAGGLLVLEHTMGPLTSSLKAGPRIAIDIQLNTS